VAYKPLGKAKALCLAKTRGYKPLGLSKTKIGKAKALQAI